MVTAIVMLSVDPHRVPEIAQEIAGLDGVSEVYSVTGRFDLVAILRVHSVEDLAPLVTEHLLRVGGITHSETMFAFKTYSQHDLEAMFSVGLK